MRDIKDTKINGLFTENNRQEIKKECMIFKTQKKKKKEKKRKGKINR